MSFKEVLDLECDMATGLGGVDKKSGKKNPTQVEGYLLGSKEIPDRFSKSGTGLLHVFQTEDGKVGIFGKTDSNRKLKGVTPGTMTRITFTGTIPTKFGDMSKYKVETDVSNTIDVGLINSPNNEAPESSDDSSYEADDAPYADEEEEAADEVVPQRPVKPAKPATTPDAARQARVQALLSAGKKTA